jgi:hypothetical protein
VSEPVDWLLLGRYALLVALCELIPVPLLDSWVANLLRRRLVRAQLEARGVELEPAEIKLLGDAVSGGCVGCLWAAVIWPIKKLLKTVVVVFTVKAMADTVSEIVHRGLLLEEALDEGWLPGETDKVRAAMDRALEHVDTRLVEQALRGTLRSSRKDLNEAVVESVRVARERLRDRPGHALADAAEANELGAGVNRVSRAMTAALQVSGLVPELVQWFRHEMGVAPAPEPGLAGPVEPEVVGDPDEAPVFGALEVVEEANEVTRPGGGEE